MIVVMPMAGRGSRFSNEGYAIPKPLIEVLGVPMFVQALKSIEGVPFSKLVLICLEEHEKAYNISGLIKHHLGHLNVHLICIPDITEGQLCTVMEAKEEFKDDSLLVIASDSYIQGNLQSDLENLTDADGIISVIDLPGESWSFARTDDSGKVVQVAEKERISDHASTGIYYFKDGNEFISIGTEMKAKDERVRGEFYIIPVYQKMIAGGKLIRISEANQMWDMGTPENLQKFVNHFQNR
jgi:NDP-sugar pyrophosphorylase family protein